MARRRLDAELVRRGMARSRAHATSLVEAGRVQVRGQVAVKAATQVDGADPLVVSADTDDPEYASRGGFKLAGALDELAIPVSGRHCLDAGASTGGFTDVLLRGGAAHVVAADVGYGQLVWRLRTDPRVTVLDRTNVRQLRAGQIDPVPDLVVADLSFISLTLVLEPLASCASDGADLVVMVKPQFEVGRSRLGKGGVVRDPQARIDAVMTVAGAARELGIGTLGVAASPLPGPRGNVEYFLWLRRDDGGLDPSTVSELVTTAVAQGPSGEQG